MAPKRAHLYALATFQVPKLVVIRTYVLVILIWTQSSVFLVATHKIHKGRYTPLTQKISYIAYSDGVRHVSTGSVQSSAGLCNIYETRGRNF